MMTVMGGVVDTKSLNGAQSTQVEEVAFPFTLPKDGTELSAFPEPPCDCNRDDESEMGGFVPSEKFPYATAPDSTTNLEQGSYGSDYLNNNNLEIIPMTNNEKPDNERSGKIKNDEDANVIKQVIFIEPPEYVYNHNIKVAQSNEKRPRTVIYVFPPMVSHVYNISDQRNLSNSQEKPQVYYLGGTTHFDGEESNQGGNEGREKFEARNEYVVENDDKSESLQETGDDAKFGNSESQNEQTVESSYLPVAQIKRNSEITEASRQNFAKRKPEITIQHSVRSIISRVGHPEESTTTSTTPRLTTTITTTTPPPKKQYRRFDYFSKSDYENLKSKGQLSFNFVQYRTGPIPTPPQPSPPPPPSPSLRSPNYDNKPFSIVSNSTNLNQLQLTTDRPFIPSSPEIIVSKRPTVRLEYERIQHFPQQRQAFPLNSQSLSLPPLPSTNEFRPSDPDHHPLEYRTIQYFPKPEPDQETEHTDQNYVIQEQQNPMFTRSHFQQELDNQASGSEMEPNLRSDYQIIPAVFRNYLYVGPTGPEHENI